ncbi:hypothetical protein B0H13DRAFT_2654434 [Mycena leptocephala]|nr:hypothetical protein B0H13DRAFT_2654434 [Mycena leptocephala]
MPQYNTTVEDYSPIITYSSDWRAGTSADSLADLYSDSSFTLTSSNGGTATFTYNGTSFSIFGAKRGNHGQFQAPLFSSPPLTQALHTVTLTNQGNSFVDIDFITWQSSVGADNEQLIVTTVQDTDPSFVYTPANLWGTNPPSIGTYSGSSGHGTATPGAFMTYTFQEMESRYTGLSDRLVLRSPYLWTAELLLYSATNLGPGTHIVKVAYQPSQPGQIFAIDYANVYSTPSLQPATSMTPLPGAAIAGIVIALLFVLVILAGLLIILRRRKGRKNRTSLEAPMVQPSLSNRDIVAAPGTYPASVQAPVRYAASADGSYYPSVHSAPTLALDTRSQVYVPSAPSDSEYSPTSHAGNIMRATSSASSQRSNPPVNAFPKGTPLPLPPSASQSLTHVPTAELRANRRVVPGRAQDFGTAPPDYVQATEPYGRATAF